MGKRKKKLNKKGEVKSVDVCAGNSKVNSKLKKPVLLIGNSKKVSKKKKGIRLNYSANDVVNALKAIDTGVSLRKAATAYGVPVATLFRRKRNPELTKRKTGPAPVFSQTEELRIVDWILFRAQRGSPVTKTELLDSVQQYVKLSKKETPFIDCRPSRHWYEGFRKRHPQLSNRKPQHLTLSRAAVTSDDLKDWLEEQNSYLTEKNLNNIGPERTSASDYDIFNKRKKSKKTVHEEKNHDDITEDSQKHLLTFEKNLAKELLQEFRDAAANQTWPKDLQKKAFFEYWLNISRRPGINLKGKPIIPEVASVNINLNEITQEQFVDNLSYNQASTSHNNFNLNDRSFSSVEHDLLLPIDNNSNVIQESSTLINDPVLNKASAPEIYKIVLENNSVDIIDEPQPCTEENNSLELSLQEIPMNIDYKNISTATVVLLNDDSNQSSPDPSTDVWSCFERETGGRARCVVCRTTLSNQQRELKYHLRDKHPKLLGEVLQDSENGSEINEDDDQNETIYTEVVYLDDSQNSRKSESKDIRTPRKVERSRSIQERRKEERRKRRDSSSSDEYLFKKKKVDKDDEELEKFGTYITCLLKKMPRDVCMKLQMEIVSLIMKTKL